MNNKNNNGFLRNAFLYIIVIIAIVTGVQYFAGGSQSPSQQLSYTQLVKKIEDGKVKSITYQPDGSIIEVKGSYKKAEKVDTDLSLPFLGGASSETRSFTSTVLQNETTMQALQSASEAADVNVKMIRESSSGAWISYLFSYIPLIGIAIFFLFMMNQGGNRGAMNFGRNRAKTQSKENIKVRFTDVAGAEEEKEELVEVVDFLKNPRKYKALGARIPKGVLLEGPPGTGKTLLAKAVAGEADVPFFSISGSDFVEMFVGVGASRVRDMFEQAKKNAPCLIFIDEIDAVGRQRGAGLGGGHDEREQTLNQMLVEMDGFGGNEGVIVIAATNRPDVLDPALTRPGRFDRQVVVGLPDVKGREQILKVHMRKVPVADDVDAMTLARGTPGYSGADLANLVNEAALFAARSNKRTVSMLEFEKAKDKINMGPERRTMIMTDKQKESTAYHEAGHAIVGYLVPEHDPVHKVTIIPRGRALGVTFFLPEGDQISISQKQLESKLSTLYAGRLAEDLIYGEENISTGASNDIKVATNIARNMVTQWGFSDKLGPILYTEDEGEVFLGRSMAKAKHMSDETAHAIDEEVRAIVNRNYARARQILIDNMDILHAMKDALVKYETIEEEQIKQLMNREPVTPPSGWEDNKDKKPTVKPQEEKTESAVNHSEDPEA